MQLLKDNLANLKVITGSIGQGKKTDVLIEDMSGNGIKSERSY